jgi:hypothetical protein
VYAKIQRQKCHVLIKELGCPSGERDVQANDGIEIFKHGFL